MPTLERQLALFHATRRQAGRPPAVEIPLKRECYVAPDSRTTLTEAAPFLDAKYAAYRRWGQDRALPAGETFRLDIEALMRDRFIVGDPARVTDELERYRERLGATTIILRLQWPGMEQARVLRSIRLLGEEVLPRLAAG